MKGLIFCPAWKLFKSAWFIGADGRPSTSGFEVKGLVSLMVAVARVSVFLSPIPHRARGLIAPAHTMVR